MWLRACRASSTLTRLIDTIQITEGNPELEFLLVRATLGIARTEFERFDRGKGPIEGISNRSIRSRRNARWKVERNRQRPGIKPGRRIRHQDRRIEHGWIRQAPNVRT